MEQIGFSFAGETPSFVLAAPGTWGKDSLTATAAAHLARLDSADAALLGLVGPARALFAEYIQTLRRSLASQVERMALAPGVEFRVWGERNRYEEEDLSAFIAHCSAMVGSGFDGIEYKIRDTPQMKAVGMYVRGVGTLVARVWPGFSVGLDFTLIERENFFLDSYRDGSPSIELAYNEWPRGMCQRFAESGNEVPVGITHMVNGREYVITGSCSGGRAKSWRADGWALAPAATWDGPTFTYETLIKAYDAGTMERGDHRGQLVRVRGVLCVLESFATLTDANGDANFRLALDAPEEALVEGTDWEDEEAEEGAELEACA